MRTGKFLVKAIDFIIALVGWMFLIGAGYCLVTGETFGSLIAGAMAVAIPGKIKKQLEKVVFSVEEYVSDKGKRFLGAKFTREAWQALSMAKRASLRTNVLAGFNFKQQVWVVDSEIKDAEVASATINSLLMDKTRDSEEGLNEYELKTYHRMQEKEANKGKKGSTKAANIAAKIQAIQDMIKDGTVTGIEGLKAIQEL